MQNSSSSENTDLMAKFLPIAPRNENQVIFPPGKKYDTPDFVTTVLSMREKLSDYKCLEFFPGRICQTYLPASGHNHDVVGTQPFQHEKSYL